MLIYQAIAPSRKSYIGLTRETIDDRKKRHKDSVDRGSKYAFHRAIRKYGFNNIKWKIIEDNITEWKNLIKKEQLYIKKFNTYVPNGYNMTMGGDGVFGLKHSEKSKKLMRQVQKGKIISQEQRDKLSKWNEFYEYVLISPDGIEYKTKTLNRFCQEHNLNRCCIRNIFLGKQVQHRGWVADILRKI